MQEFQSIPGLAGRLFGGAADLRRAHQAQQQQGPAGAARCGGVSPAPPEAIKCPRCESTNTKFCYYNNYNLSQPRHFCKSCRRYWTKGGVLRNVPVGGGCRKAKRSSSSSSSSPSSAPSTPTSATAADGKNPRRASASSPRSNSDSASPTAATKAQAPTTTAPATSSSNSIALTASPFSTVDVAPPAPIFADQAAALASIFAPPPPPPPLPVFAFAAEPKVESAMQLAGQPSEAGVSSSASGDMTPFASLDTAGMFDLGDASAAAYWSAGSCWTDVVHDPTMYLP
ncbi:hypothetical protein HU200_017547 [Digitaria exilis]|uniref:Dof zinc finger protein n=1 Tax=Digitaria exilis TaxID=1010633 RepID=A0A835F6P0_9POAL|nr:hypothetical protein HU200_017547 [Digitaria exilis]